MQNDPKFTNGFLQRCSNIDLALLQHELRRHPEDADHLAEVLAEMARRAKDREGDDAE